MPVGCGRVFKLRLSEQEVACSWPVNGHPAPGPLRRSLSRSPLEGQRGFCFLARWFRGVVRGAGPFLLICRKGFDPDRKGPEIVSGPSRLLNSHRYTSGRRRNYLLASSATVT